MELLIILALAAAVFWLWKQLETLRLRIEMLEKQEYVPAEPAAEASVPRIALKSRTEIDAVISEPRVSVELFPPAEASASRPDEESAQDWAPPVPEAETEEPRTAPKKRFDIEDIFGRRLPIWVGGITLAIAGVLLVRYSIEAGLVTPPVRVAMAFLFGLALLAGAEFTHRKANLVNDRRICQALAGAGLATLYAAFYLAGTQYGLIGQTLAFVGLAAVTAGAIGLSFRFGLPCAILGLVGGFAAPLLVGGDEANLPLLTIYLGLVTVGLTQAGERQGRPWLSLAALGVGLGWGVLLLLSEDFGTAEIMALGFYLLLLGAILPSLINGGAFARPVRLASAFLASLQLALLVDKAGDGLLAWALYLLMGATLAGLAWRRSELREGSAVAMVIAIGLLTQWDPAVGWSFYAIAAGIAAIFVAVPLVHFWRRAFTLADTLADRAQLAGGPLALGLAMFAVAGNAFFDAAEPVLASALLALAALPAAGAWSARSMPERDKWAAIFSAVAALLLLASALLVTPSWTAPLVAAAIFGGLFYTCMDRTDAPSRRLLNGAGLLVAITLLVSDGIELEAEQLFTARQDTFALQSIVRWLSAGLALGALVWRNGQGRAFAAAQVGAALAGYGLTAQVLPDTVLPWATALAVIALRFAPFASVAGQSALCAVTALWALLPLIGWGGTGLEAIAGRGPLAFDWPVWTESLLRILPMAAALFALRYSGARTKYISAELPRIMGLGLVLVVIHILYKQVFGIETQTAFVASAFAERTVWQALLLAAAFGATKPIPRLGPQPAIAAVFASLALAHLAWFTGVAHSPLFTQQAVGSVPVANLALAAGAVGLAAAWILRSLAPDRLKTALDAVAMITIAACALALLRQVFSGSILTAQPLGQTEDLLRSLLGIVLAIAFLLIGRMRDEQSWRIGSLVLMVLAVAKVFLVDAAALEGLLRIASFMALGFSLLGIGWLYARQLGTSRKNQEPETV